LSSQENTTHKALYDNDDIVIVAELSQVLAPALLVVLGRTDKVAPPRVILEAGIEPVYRKAGQQQGNCKHEPGEPADSADQPGQYGMRKRRFSGKKGNSPLVR